MTKKKIIVGSLVVVLVAAGVVFFMPKSSESDTPKWITSVVTSQNITQSITATGTIEPVTQVDVGTQVSGILTTLYVDYNSVVKEGQIIAELDKSTLLLDRNSKRNSVAVAKSNYEYELANYARVEALYKKDLIAASEYEVALYSYESAKNNYEISKNNLAQSETNLGYATIYAPIDGVVLSRSVEEGQTVASSFSTPTLFIVAADLKDMRVITDVDEADIGNVKEGQRARFTVDAFPMDTFEGVVTQVRQEAIIESNVTTYEVVVSAANPDLKLKPGLTANVEIFTLDEDCETVVPSSALYFTPPMPADAPQGGPQGGQGGPQGGQGAPNGKDGRPVGMGDPDEDASVVWILRGGRPEPRNVTVGVNNGVLAGVNGLNLRDSVITGMSAAPTAGAMQGGPQSSTSPFAPQRPGGRR